MGTPSSYISGFVHSLVAAHTLLRLTRVAIEGACCSDAGHDATMNSGFLSLPAFSPVDTFIKLASTPANDEDAGASQGVESPSMPRIVHYQ